MSKFSKNVTFNLSDSSGVELDRLSVNEIELSGADDGTGKAGSNTLKKPFYFNVTLADDVRSVKRERSPSYGTVYDTSDHHAMGYNHVTFANLGHNGFGMDPENTMDAMVGNQQPINPRSVGSVVKDTYNALYPRSLHTITYWSMQNALRLPNRRKSVTEISLDGMRNNPGYYNAQEGYFDEESTQADGRAVESANVGFGTSRENSALARDFQNSLNVTKFIQPAYDDGRYDNEDCRKFMPTASMNNQPHVVRLVSNAGGITSNQPFPVDDAEDVWTSYEDGGNYKDFYDMSSYPGGREWATAIRNAAEKYNSVNGDILAIYASLSTLLEGVPFATRIDDDGKRHYYVNAYLTNCEDHHYIYPALSFRWRIGNLDGEYIDFDIGDELGFKLTYVLDNGEKIWYEDPSSDCYYYEIESVPDTAFYVDLDSIDTETGEVSLFSRFDPYEFNTDTCSAENKDGFSKNDNPALILHFTTDETTSQVRLSSLRRVIESQAYPSTWYRTIDTSSWQATGNNTYMIIAFDVWSETFLQSESPITQLAMDIYKHYVAGDDLMCRFVTHFGDELTEKYHTSPLRSVNKFRRSVDPDVRSNEYYIRLNFDHEMPQLDQAGYYNLFGHSNQDPYGIHTAVMAAGYLLKMSITYCLYIDEETDEIMFVDSAHVTGTVEPKIPNIQRQPTHIARTTPSASSSETYTITTSAEWDAITLDNLRVIRGALGAFLDFEAGKVVRMRMPAYSVSSISYMQFANISSAAVNSSLSANTYTIRLLFTAPAVSSTDLQGSSHTVMITFDKTLIIEGWNRMLDTEFMSTHYLATEKESAEFGMLCRSICELANRIQNLYSSNNGNLGTMDVVPVGTYPANYTFNNFGDLLDETGFGIGSYPVGTLWQNGKYDVDARSVTDT